MPGGSGDWCRQFSVDVLGDRLAFLSPERT
jgi:hypothetical protein